MSFTLHTYSTSHFSYSSLFFTSFTHNLYRNLFFGVFLYTWFTHGLYLSYKIHLLWVIELSHGRWFESRLLQPPPIISVYSDDMMMTMIINYGYIRLWFFLFFFFLLMWLKYLYLYYISQKTHRIDYISTYINDAIWNDMHHDRGFYPCFPPL